VEDRVKYRERVMKLLADHTKWFGGFHCTVDPPTGERQLRWAVLGSNSKDGKFVFDLRQGKRDCWCSPEIARAVDLGYMIRRVHEFHRFKEQRTDLFKEFIAVCTTGKDHASGDRGMTAEEVKEHVARYAAIGIKIDPAKFFLNEGVRQLFKLVLNAAGYGKLAQRNDFDTVKIVASHADLAAIEESDRYETVKRTILGEDRVEVIYKVAGKHVTESNTSCIYAASFVTSWARLKLHEQLHRLGHQVFYMDTDSVKYDSFPGGKEVKQGSILGEWTNEFDMKGVDYWITGEFVSSGAKTYAYKYTTDASDEVLKAKGLDRTYETCKCAGFTLNHEGSPAINFETMRDLVLNRVKDEDGNLLEKQKLELRAFKICVDDATRGMYNYMDEKEKKKEKGELGMNKKLVCEYTKGELVRSFDRVDGKDILTSIKVVPFGWEA